MKASDLSEGSAGSDVDLSCVKVLSVLQVQG